MSLSDSVSIAVVGAGMAGLACATALRKRGHVVTVLDKARGPGGRLSTRRLTTPLGETTFDHGAPCFTVTDPDFQTQVDGWRLSGLVAPWPAAGPGAWVGTPGMNAPLKAMAEDLASHWNTPVTGLSREQAGWSAHNSLLPGAVFDALVVAVPAEQAAVLLAPVAPDFAALARDCRSTPCWTLMVVFEAAIPVVSPVLTGDGAAAWAGRETSKPDRTGPEAWVIQADPAWTGQYLEIAPERAAQMLLEAFERKVGAPLPPAVSAIAHRWRYARPSAAFGVGCLWDSAARIGVCGDWLGGASAEGAWRSGVDLARAMTRGDAPSETRPALAGEPA